MLEEAPAAVDTALLGAMGQVPAPVGRPAAVPMGRAVLVALEVRTVREEVPPLGVPRVSRTPARAAMRVAAQARAEAARLAPVVQAEQAATPPMAPVVAMQPATVLAGRAARPGPAARPGTVAVQAVQTARPATQVGTAVRELTPVDRPAEGRLQAQAAVLAQVWAQRLAQEPQRQLPAPEELTHLQAVAALPR
jgi:hypothetical protein